MSESSPLRDTFLTETGRQEFASWATKYLLSNLPDGGITCKSDMEANDNTENTWFYYYGDLWFLDNQPNRIQAISPVFKWVLSEAKEKANSVLAPPYVLVVVEHDEANVRFKMTVSIRFVNPNK